jgi:hypothetical protein
VFFTVKTVPRLCHVTVGEMSAFPRLRHNQQVPGQSVQASKASRSPLNMFEVVARVFQQIMTQLIGAESQENRIMVIDKIVLKLVRQND